MLYSLSIENIALIDKLQIEFGSGLNVLTGESGAGKSIIVNSMNLLLGERADKDLVKSGCENAYVEAVFYIDKKICELLLNKHDIKCEDELIVSRKLSLNGKNICKINGITVNLITLKNIMGQIIDLHGQNTHTALLKAENHILILDSFADESIIKLKEKISKLYNRLLKLKNDQFKYGGKISDRLQKIDTLTFQINELKSANITDGEIEHLLKERNWFINVEKIFLNLQNCYDLLYGSENFKTAISLINNCEDLLSDISQYSNIYNEYIDRIDEIKFNLEDLVHEIHNQIETINVNEVRREEIEERLSFLRSLFRKYDVNDEKELINLLNNFNDELYNIKDSEENIKEINKNINIVEKQLVEEYKLLSRLRFHAASFLKESMEIELNELGMMDAKFEVRFKEKDEKSVFFSNDGVDSVEFYLSTNNGEILKPLIKTASGGEMSRIMLAFKKLYAKNDTISTFVFDEIDTGLSGKMALTIAEKLAFIASKKQVICVSHLPQIAAMADQNYLITKTNESKESNTTIKLINNDNLIEEIARLSGGISSRNAYEHAKELKERANNFKIHLKNT